jgi:hypothetical protein
MKLPAISLAGRHCSSGRLQGVVEIVEMWLINRFAYVSAGIAGRRHRGTGSPRRGAEAAIR